LSISIKLQTMSLVLTSELTKEALCITEDPDEPSSIYVECFSDSQVWDSIMYWFITLVRM